MQPERDPMADATLVSLPDNAVIRGADAEPSFGTDDGQDCRLGPPGAQEKASHAAGDRRGEHLVDHDPALRLDMLDGEDRATWQKAYGDPGAVGDLDEAEIVSPRRRQNLFGRVGHSL